MQIIELSHRGEAVVRNINRRSLMTEFSLHPRDLRPVFSLRQVTTILCRGNAIILNFKTVKLILGHDRVLVFNLENKLIADEFVPMLSAKVTQNEEDTPFVLLVLEASLAYVTQLIRARFDRLSRESNSLLEALERQPNDEHLTRLLQLKKRLSETESRAQEAEDMVAEYLEDEGDMRELLLSGGEETEISEVESILENSLEQLENVSHQIDELNENIDDTQEIINMKLATLRNEIIRFDLIISVMTAILGVLAVIVGLFGTNIKNELENSNTAFWILTALLVLIFILGWRGIYRYMKRKRLL